MEFNYIVEICVGIGIAILGIAYPIIIDKISNIGEKYSSNYLSELFNREFPQKKTFNNVSIFQFVLYANIISYLFLILPLPPLFVTNIQILDEILANSSMIIVLLFTIFLVVFFFIWIKKVFIYNGKVTTLIQRIIIKYKSLKNGEYKKYCLKTINELTYFALKESDNHLQAESAIFYTDEFSKIRRNHNSKEPLEYPYDLYEFNYNICFELINNGNERYSVLERAAVSGNWLLGGDIETIKLSELTYKWLWRINVVIIEREKYLQYYWETASQYFSYRLERIIEEYDPKSHDVLNQSDVDVRNEERNRFLEFHYALGGLLMYSHKDDSIKYILSFSQSYPPTYILLPETMTEIFYWFNHFRTGYYHDVPIDRKYSFPNLNNLGVSMQINHWICLYLALLIVRQFYRVEYYTYQNFKELVLPTDLQILYSWYDGIEYLRRCLKIVLKNNKELLIKLGYDDWDRNNKTVSLIDDYESQIKEKIGVIKLSATLSQQKLDSFNDSTKEILNNAFNEYVSKKIFQSEKIKKKKTDLSIVIRGYQSLYPKSAFVDGDIPHLSFDSFLASNLANRTIKREIPNSFLVARTRRYLTEKDKLIAAIEKLNIDRDKFLIIGVNLLSDIEQELKKYSDILKVVPSSENYLKNVLFIMKKEDLPTISFKELPKEEIERYDLKRIDKELNLYTSIKDLNPEKVKSDWETEANPRDFEVNVLVSIAFHTEINFRKERDIVQINIASPYREEGIISPLNEITPFDND